MDLSGVDIALVAEVVVVAMALAFVSTLFLHKRSKELEIARERHDRVVANLEQLQKQFQNVNSELLAAQEKIEYLENQLLEQSLSEESDKDQLAALQEELNRLREMESRFSSSHEELQQNKQELERLRYELSMLESSSASYHQEAEALRETLDRLEKEKESLEVELRQLQQLDYQSMPTKPSSDYKDEWDSLKPTGDANKHDEYKIEIAELKELCAKQSFEISELNKQLNKTDSASELVVAQGRITSLESQLTQAESCIGMLEEELGDFRAQGGPVESEAKEHLAQAQSRVTELEEQLAVTESCVAMLEDKLLALNSEEAQNAAEKAAGPQVMEEPHDAEEAQEDSARAARVITQLPLSDFQMAIGSCSDIESLADAVLDSIADTGLAACLRIQGQNKIVARSTSGDVWPEDLEKLAGLTSADDEGETEVLITSGRLALLLKDMPFYDPVQCEQIKENMTQVADITAKMAGEIYATV